MDSIITVFKLSLNGSSFITDNLQEIMCVLDDGSYMEHDEEYIIVKEYMSKEDFSNLPEFDGF